jgi:hypothetical protein
VRRSNEMRARAEAAAAVAARLLLVPSGKQFNRVLSALFISDTPVDPRLHDLLADRALEALAPAAPLLSRALDDAEQPAAVRAELRRRVEPLLVLLGAAVGLVEGATPLLRLRNALDVLKAEADVLIIAHYARLASSSKAGQPPPPKRERACAFAGCLSRARPAEQLQAVPKLQCCAGCRGVFYCETRCQESAWVQQGHKLFCPLVAKAREEAAAAVAAAVAEATAARAVETAATTATTGEATQ